MRRKKVEADTDTERETKQSNVHKRHCKAVRMRVVRARDIMQGYTQSVMQQMV